MSIVIDERYCGFHDTAHGGYLGGLLAEGATGPARVSLRRPVPIGRPLHIDRRGEEVVASGDDGEVLAELKPTTLELEAPEAVTPAAAEQASSSYPGHRFHHFGSCFCCGPDRAAGDGLRIFPGRVPGGDLVGAIWDPAPTDADEDGIVRPEIVWAAFDCPQLWALILGAPDDSVDRVVTGALETDLLGPVKAGERHVVVAWPEGEEGRRLFAGAAIFSGDGEPLGLGRQTAVRTKAGVPLGLSNWS